MSSIARGRNETPPNSLLVGTAKGRTVIPGRQFSPLRKIKPIPGTWYIFRPRLDFLFCSLRGAFVVAAAAVSLVAVVDVTSRSGTFFFALARGEKNMDACYRSRLRYGSRNPHEIVLKNCVFFKVWYSESTLLWEASIHAMCSPFCVLLARG